MSSKGARFIKIIHISTAFINISRQLIHGSATVNFKMIYIYVVCLLLVLYYFYQRNYNYWKSKNVPFEKPFLFFGSFYDLVARKKHIHHKLREIYDKYKTPYVGIYILNQPALVIRSPTLLKKILVKDFDKFMNRKMSANESVDPIAFHTLFSSKNDAWRNARIKISPVFTSAKLKLMVPLMKECAADLREYFSDHAGEVLEMRSVTKRFSVDIISSCAFGINSCCLKNENSEILRVATDLLDMKSFVRNISVFCFFFVPSLIPIFRLKFVDYTAAEYLMAIFKNTIKVRANQKIERHDLIDVLNTISRNETAIDGYQFDDIKMAAQAITFFSAGNDTISITISYILYELALNKEIQNRLRHEIRKSFEQLGEFTYESLQGIKYLDMVINEALRKYPLTTFLNRNSETKYTFEETGFTLDKDTNILIPVAGLHYDPEYFPDPETFDPERFSDENKDNIQPFTYLPFGDGPRNCIGQRFGMLVMKIALAYTLKDFAFEKSSQTTVPMQLELGSMFMQPKCGVSLKVLQI